MNNVQKIMQIAQNLSENDEKKIALKALVEKARREKARRHLLPFVRYNFKEYDTNWHHELIADELENVFTGAVKRLMIFIPPRHGKSELASVQFPAWYIGKRPSKDIISVSYSADLADDFGKRVRNLVASEEYNRIFNNVKLAEDSKASSKWNTNHGGSYRATGIGGPITGRGANILLIDDPIKNREEADSVVRREQIWKWYRSTAYTRLAPGGAIILILTRWHDDDLAGRILSSSGSAGWRVIELPAIAKQTELIEGKYQRVKGTALWPEWYSLEDLNSTKNAIGTFEFSALYQQNPIDDESQEFHKEWFQYRKEDEVKGLLTRRFLTVDTAGALDSAGNVTKQSDFIGVCDNRVDREGKWNLITKKLKMNSADLIEYLFYMQNKYNYEKIGIEKTIYSDAIEPFLAPEMIKRGITLPIFPLKHGGRSKELRIRSLLPLYKSGYIYHIIDECDELESQLLRFPKGAHDDVMDATAYQSQVAEVPFGYNAQRTVGWENVPRGTIERPSDPFNPIGEI